MVVDDFYENYDVWIDKNMSYIVNKPYSTIAMNMHLF